MDNADRIKITKLTCTLLFRNKNDMSKIEFTGPNDHDKKALKISMKSCFIRGQRLLVTHVETHLTVVFCSVQRKDCRFDFLLS